MIWPGDLSVTCCALFTTFLDRLATTTFDVDVRGGDASHTEEWAALGEIERHMEPEGESPTAAAAPAAWEARLEARRQVQLWDSSVWLRLQTSACQECQGARGTFPQGGNTCFIAALLQCLLHCRAVEVWLQRRECNCGSETCFSCLLAATANGSKAPGATLNLAAWWPAVSALGFPSGEQQDLGEFLKAFLASSLESAGVACRLDAVRFFSAFQFDERLLIRKVPTCTCPLAATTNSSVVRTERFLELALPPGIEIFSISSLLRSHLQETVPEPECHNIIYIVQSVFLFYQIVCTAWPQINTCFP
jgi:hypothetical protein